MSSDSMNEYWDQGWENRFNRTDHVFYKNESADELRDRIQKKVDEVTLWMQGSPFFEDILKEFGFSVDGVSGGGWPGATRPMICRFNVDPEKYRPHLNEKDWYFTMGDTLEIY